MINKTVYAIFGKMLRKNRQTTNYELFYEYCPRCEANLTLQKGYSNELLYWKCLGCGEMLINPEIESDSGIVWLCDKCQEMLNIQPGFSESINEWKCTECGHINEINVKEVYVSDDEYQRELGNPYRGLDDDALLKLSQYEEVECIGDRGNVILVRDRENQALYVKKILTFYDYDIYQFLKDHPIEFMPKIFGLYEGKDILIVIEEYVRGKTLEEILEAGPISENSAITIAQKICKILDCLHGLDMPIVHRDIKASNIIVTQDDEIWLLDMNVAKIYDPDQRHDTWFMGTWLYAAPEQVGYGLKASSPKTDIYALGILMNVMVTGKFPNDEQAKGELWDIIQKCISLNSDDRYTAKELEETLMKVGKD